MTTSCGFCARAGFDECFCDRDSEGLAESLDISVEHYYLEEGVTIGRNEERARIRRELLAVVHGKVIYACHGPRFDPVSAVKLEELITALDRICPKEGNSATTAWQIEHEARQEAVNRAYVDGRNEAREAERTHLRPLLERILDLVESTGWRVQYQERAQVLLADLRRELGKEG